MRKFVHFKQKIRNYDLSIVSLVLFIVSYVTWQQVWTNFPDETLSQLISSLFLLSSMLLFNVYFVRKYDSLDNRFFWFLFIILLVLIFSWSVLQVSVTAGILSLYLPILIFFIYSPYKIARKILREKVTLFKLLSSYAMLTFSVMTFFVLIYVLLAPSPNIFREESFFSYLDNSEIKSEDISSIDYFIFSGYSQYAFTDPEMSLNGMSRIVQIAQLFISSIIHLLILGVGIKKLPPANK